MNLFENYVVNVEIECVSAIKNEHEMDLNYENCSF